MSSKDSTQNASSAPRSLRPTHGAENSWARRRDAALAVIGWALIVGGVLWLAGHIVHTLLILALAALFAYAIAPGVTLLHRKLPKWLSVTIVYVVVLFIVMGVLYILVSALVTEVTMLVAQLQGILSLGSNGGDSPLMRALKGFGLSSSQLDAARTWLTSKLASVASAATPIVTGVIGGLFDVLLIAVLSIYFLYDGPRVVAWLRREMPLSQRNRSEFVIGALQRVVGGYIRGELILCSLIGLLVGGGMQLIGVPFAILLGALAFFFEFIPFLGPVFSFVACMLVAATQGWVTMLMVLIYFIFIHAVEAYIVGPRVLGRSIGLHPAISIIALLVGGEVFGLWGALFGAPIAGLVQVLLATIWREWRVSHPMQFASDTLTEDDDPGLNIFGPPAPQPPTHAAPDTPAPPNGRVDGRADGRTDSRARSSEAPT